jgi:hypothetical protein
VPVVFPDVTPPVITISGILTVDATSASGAVVTFGATAQDDRDGETPVTCDHASGQMFPLGTTPVQCSATDGAGNTATASFVVTVRDVSMPGEMDGAGLLVEGGSSAHFTFHVSERSSERGHLHVQTRGDDDATDSGLFLSQAVTFVAFSDSPSYEPGSPIAPVDTVRFSGTGYWNGLPGYRFDVFATDQGEPGRHRDVARITIEDPSGVVVANIEGELEGGNIQARAIPR